MWTLLWTCGQFVDMWTLMWTLSGKEVQQKGSEVNIRVGGDRRTWSGEEGGGDLLLRQGHVRKLSLVPFYA
jgi:hypothetical protein